MGNKPIKKFMDRLLSVAVWENEGNGSGKFHTVSMSRGYKKDGEFKSTNSLRPEDLSSARELLKQAENFIENINTEAIEALDEG